LRNATVYIAGRSQEKGETAILKLKEETRNERVYFLKLDLADIPSAVSAAKELISKETRLDILLNNAYGIYLFSKLMASGVMTPEDGKTVQGYDLTWVLLLQKRADFRVPTSSDRSFSPKNSFLFFSPRPRDTQTQLGSYGSQVKLICSAPKRSSNSRILISQAQNGRSIVTVKQ